MSGRRQVTYSPLDVTCPACRSQPRVACASVVDTARRGPRRPHAERVTLARVADARRREGRAGAATSDAWTCPDCRQTYRAPPSWEPRVWQAALRVAQIVHAEKHGRRRPEVEG